MQMVRPKMCCKAANVEEYMGHFPENMSTRKEYQFKISFQNMRLLRDKALLAFFEKVSFPNLGYI